MMSTVQGELASWNARTLQYDAPADPSCVEAQCADVVGVEDGPTVNEGCTISIGYGPGFNPLDGSQLSLATRSATGFDLAAIVDKQDTCAAEGQDGGPGYCSCQVRITCTAVEHSSLCLHG